MNRLAPNRHELDFERRTLEFARPLHTPYGELHQRTLLVASLTGEDGITGYGEAAPLEPYDGVSIEQVESALERYRRALNRAPRLNGAQLIDACRAIEDLPQALAAIDLALWDKGGRTAGKPVAELLVDNPATEVPVNATVSSLARADAAAEAAQAAKEGYTCIKMKVGIGDDAGRLAAVRAAIGPNLELRLDANGAWDVEEAVHAIQAVAPCGLELVEEPVHGLKCMREVRERVTVRVAIDETAAEYGALGAGVADAVCLKISRCGGISGTVAAAALVRASGAEPYIASTYDGPLGIAAGLQVASALAARGPLPCCGLATLRLFTGVESTLTPSRGRIALPRGAGLGVGPP